MLSFFSVCGLIPGYKFPQIENRSGIRIYAVWSLQSPYPQADELIGADTGVGRTVSSSAKLGGKLNL